MTSRIGGVLARALAAFLRLSRTSSDFSFCSHWRVSRRRDSAFYLAGFLVLALVLFGGLRLDAQSSPGSLQVLHKHVWPVVSSGEAKRVGSLPSAQRLKLAITLPLRNESELKSLLSELSDPKSPDYRHYFSVAEFTAQFGPTEKDYQAVAGFAQANGFTVTHTHVNRLVVDIEGTAAQIQQAFHVQMNVYQHPTENRTFYSPDREPSLALSVPIAHISGLDNYFIPHPMVVKPSAGKAAAPDLTGSGPGGGYLGGDMRAAYYTGTLPNGATPLTGSGQTVGLFEYDGYSLSDVTASFDGVSYSVPINNVLIDGASAASDGDDGEQVLDIVQAIAMAPGLTQVLVYIGPLDGGNDTDIFNRMATDNIAKQLSVSWGFGDDAYFDDPIFMEFAAQGQTVFVASGDSGAYPEEINFPGEDPYVVAVGGTDLTTSGPGGSWVSETAWAGSGGGPSPDGLPIQPWQVGLANSSNQASETVRNVPDVAADAAGNNYNCDESECSSGWGGTSFAAPRWAGFLALANQQSVANGNSTIGSLAPVIYPLALNSTTYADDFHDIVSGNNNNGEGQSYNAVVGYDLVTGLGSPNGQDLIDALAGRPIATLTPGTLSFSYQVVSTTSATQSATYTNIGASPVNLSPPVLQGINAGDFALVNTGTSCPYAGGTVAVGASCTIDVQFAPTGAGTRSASVLAGNSYLSLSGTGTLAPGIGTLAPTLLTFVNQTVSTNAVMSSRVTNTGSATITFSSITMAAGSAANFSLATTGTSCPYSGGSLASGAFCTIDVQFSAPAASTATLVGSVLLPDNMGVFNGVLGTTTASLTQALSLSGNAILGPGMATLTPTTLNFGNQFINGTPTRSSLLTNIGTAQIVLNSIAVSGTNPADFPLVTTGTSCPYGGGTLAAGASCTINVEFLVPSSASSPLSANVLLNDNIGLLNGGLSSLTQSLSISGQASSNYPIPFIYASLQPAAALPGGERFTLAVSGVGFYPTSVVEWNGSPLVTTYISSSQISAAVPAGNIAAAGTASVTVKNPTPGGGVSNVAYFVVTNPTATVDYSNASGSPIGPIGDGGPNVIAVADFNGDGIPDLVIGNYNGSASIDNTSSATFDILLGNGDGTFTTKATYVGSTGFIGFITDVVPGDFNGDGIPDLAVLDFENNVVTLWLGKGDGTFTLKSTTSTGSNSGPFYAVAADFNADGKLDLAVADTGNNTISILLGNGDGTFTTGTTINAPGPYNGINNITAGDFNGDGQLDLGTSCFGSCVVVYLGNNDGTFGPPLTTNVGGDGALGVLVAADFNGDGKLDLATPDSVGNVQVLLGKGDGTFTVTTPLPAGPVPVAVTTGDFNGDGILDLAVTNSYNYPSDSSTVSVMLGNGDGTFQSQVEVPVGAEPYSIATGDFLGDGRLDLAVANSAEYITNVPTSVSVLVQPSTGTASLGTPSLDFGGQTVNTSSTAQTVKLTNTGGAALSVTGVAATTNFATTINCVTQSPLAAGASCTESVTFDPTTTGPLTGTLTFTDNSGGVTGSTQSVGLSGTGNLASTSTALLSSANPSVFGQSVTFTATVTDTSGGPAPTGTVTFTVDGAAQSPTATTSGVATLTTSALSVTTHTVVATYNGDTSTSSSSSNQVSQVVNPAATTTGLLSNLNPSNFGQSVMFTAVVAVLAPGAGTPSGSVIFKDGANSIGTSPLSAGVATLTTSALIAGPHSITASYVATTNFATSTSGPVSQVVNKATPLISWTPASIQFGYTLTSAQLDATANVAGTSFAYTPPLGTQITNTSQTLSVLFTPADTTDYNTASKTVPLTVTAGPLASISASSIAFGTVFQGSITTKNVTVTNVGNAAMTITGPFLSVVKGGNSEEFVEANECPKSLAAGKSCTISITFIAGPYYNPQTATLNIMDNSPVNPQSVALSATVIDPQASFNPGSLSFGTQTVGSSTVKTVQLKNTGATTLSNIAISVTGANKAEFMLTPASTCGTTLTSGSSCTISVTFKPAASKTSYSATLQVTDNTQSGMQTVPLSGSGH